MTSADSEREELAGLVRELGRGARAGHPGLRCGGRLLRRPAPRHPAPPGRPAGRPADARADRGLGRTPPSAASPSVRTRSPTPCCTRPPPAGERLDAFVVRKAGKAHGLQRRIEGPDVAGRRVLVVEDTSTTGGSVLTAVRGGARGGCGGRRRGHRRRPRHRRPGGDRGRGRAVPLAARPRRSRPGLTGLRRKRAKAAFARSDLANAAFAQVERPVVSWWPGSAAAGASAAGAAGSAAAGAAAPSAAVPTPAGSGCTAPSWSGFCAPACCCSAWASLVASGLGVGSAHVHLLGAAPATDEDPDRVDGRGLVGLGHHRRAVRSVTGPRRALQRCRPSRCRATSIVDGVGLAPPPLSWVARKNAGAPCSSRAPSLVDDEHPAGGVEVPALQAAGR